MDEVSYTIDPASDGDGYWVHSHGEYPEHSVLAGQYQRVKCKWFKTVEEAQTEYPAAKVNDSPALPMFLFTRNISWPNEDDPWGLDNY